MAVQGYPQLVEACALPPGGRRAQRPADGLGAGVETDPVQGGRLAQVRTPISDGTYGEPWVWRFKDIRNWWSHAHHNRPGGVRSGSPTAWVPGSKPIWFTEAGCGAVDKGANQPNIFGDDKSAES